MKLEDIERYKNNQIAWRKHKKEIDKLEKEQRSFEKNILKKLIPILDKLKVFSDSNYSIEFGTYCVKINFYNIFGDYKFSAIDYEKVIKIENYEDLLKVVK